MQTITCQEFNRRTSHVQKMAEREPVLITQHGKPAFVLQSYQNYEKNQKAGKSFLQVLLDANLPPELGDIELEISPRSTGQRPPVDLSMEDE
ncbi:type II toxin-antitoxin system Phd/YefM family antitoxin [Neisseriaceae bacterium B1]